MSNLPGKKVKIMAINILTELKEWTQRELQQKVYKKKKTHKKPIRAEQYSNWNKKSTGEIQ